MSIFANVIASIMKNAHKLLMMIAVAIAAVICTPASAAFPPANEMEFERSTTAFFKAGPLWQDVSGSIFIHKPTGKRYIKIFHNGERKGFVLNNRDYKEGSGPSRSKYLTNADNGITYYFY